MKLNSHQRAQLGRVARITAMTLVSSGMLAALGSGVPIARAAWVGFGTAILEAIFRQAQPVAPVDPMS